VCRMPWNPCAGSVAQPSAHHSGLSATLCPPPLRMHARFTLRLQVSARLSRGLHVLPGLRDIQGSGARFGLLSRTQTAIESLCTLSAQHLDPLSEWIIDDKRISRVFPFSIRTEHQSMLCPLVYG
jgi:hypothetical protein